MGEQFANNASTTLSGAATNVATTISVTSSTPFPTSSSGAQFRILVDSEYMIVTAISGTTWTVTRGAEGSTAAAHSSGATVTHVVTAGGLNNGGWGGGDYFRSGNYYVGGVAHSPTSVTMTVSRFYYTAFWVPVRRAFDRIAINVTTAASAASGGTVALGLYDSVAGIPGNLLASGAGISSETTGPKETTIAVTLDPGLYWTALLVRFQGCSVSGVNTIGPWMSGITAAPTSSTMGQSYFATSATSFPTSVTAGSLSVWTGGAPLVSLRAV